MADTAVLEQLTPAQLAAEISIPGDKRGKGVLFTTETAKANWAKSRESARANKELAKREASELKPDPQPPAEDPALSIIADELGRVSECLASRKLKPAERVALIGAMDRLLDRRRVLQGTPLPGSTRPQAPKAAGRADLAAEPIAARQDRDSQD